MRFIWYSWSLTERCLLMYLLVWWACSWIKEHGSYYLIFIDLHIDGCVRNTTFFLDNARICKNKFLLGWASELVEWGQFNSVRFFYMVVGHTKFQPHRLFASIAKTFYTRDVFCIEMLHTIAQLYSTSYVFKSEMAACSWCKVFSTTGTY